MKESQELIHRLLDGTLRVITSQAEKFVKEERMGREHSGEGGQGDRGY